MSVNISQTTRRGLRLVGAAALVISGSMHLDLYLTGYRSIATIGPLFLVQAIAAIGLGLVLVFEDRALFLLAGAGFTLSTLSGYLLSRAIGIFGFHEVATQAGTVAEVIELLAFLSLAEATISHRNTRARLTRSRLTDATRITQMLVVAIGTLVMVFTINGTSWSSRSARTSAIGTSVANARMITITNFAFVPASIKVTPGEQILIINKDSVAHSVTADASPGGSRIFNSGNINPGRRAVIRAPKTPGSYSYFCDVHNFMTGVITVKP